MNDPRADRRRNLVSQEAARIIADEGVRDFQLAKRKAAVRLKLDHNATLPGNAEIEQALNAHQQLFNAEEHANRLNKLRQIALNAMQAMEAFDPRLTGGLVNGVIGSSETIDLHLFSDAMEEVVLKMLALGIPYETREKRYRWHTKGPSQHIPSIRFSADGCDVELIVFPTRQAHQPPLSPIDGKPIRRISIAKLKKLIDRAA